MDCKLVKFGRRVDRAERGLAKSGSLLMLDFERVGTVSAADLSFLLSLRKRVLDGGGRLVLRNLSPFVYEVFEVCKLEDIFTIL